jgi:uncharacterized protein YecT (DUF1311 family)
MRIDSPNVPGTSEPGIACAMFELIEADPTAPKVPWAKPPEPAPTIGHMGAIRFCIASIACLLVLLVCTEPGLTETSHNRVSRVYVDDRGRPNENVQDVHIVYSNGADVVAPKEKDLESSTNPAVAEDRRTVGWLADYWGCSQSYPCPTALVIYRDGHIITKIVASGGVIWDWKFFDNGKQAGFSEGVTHGTLIPEDYRLYDVSTGGLIQKIKTANKHSPEWVKTLVRVDASAPASIVRPAEDCDAPNRSRAELNDCYGNAYKASDAELNSIYKQIEGRLKDDQVTTKLLVTAERAWVSFRDAECDFSTSGLLVGPSIR